MRAKPLPTSLVRPVPAHRSTWSGLNVPAESLLSAVDTSGEVVALTSGAWSLNKIIALALKRVGQPASIDIWTWTLSRRAIGQLLAWRRSGVAVRLVVDASLWRRQPSYGALLAVPEFLPCFRAASAHAKAAAVRGPRGVVFIAGSGNLNLCRRAELLWLSTDPALASWLEEMTGRAFEVLPAGAPQQADDDVRADALSAAFPRPTSSPSWATGLPTLKRTV